MNPTIPSQKLLQSAFLAVDLISNGNRTGCFCGVFDRCRGSMTWIFDGAGNSGFYLGIQTRPEGDSGSCPATQIPADDSGFCPAIHIRPGGDSGSCLGIQIRAVSDSGSYLVIEIATAFDSARDRADFWISVVVLGYGVQGCDAGAGCDFLSDFVHLFYQHAFVPIYYRNSIISHFLLAPGLVIRKEFSDLQRVSSPSFSTKIF